MKVGPINSQNGFPTWFKDENGVRLLLNTDVNDPHSGITTNDLPDPTKPISFPDNFPNKAYYFIAESEMQTGMGGEARLIFSLGASFMNNEPRDDEQIVFVQMSVKVMGVKPNCEYIVTHPYGVEHCRSERSNESDTGEINFTKELFTVRDSNFELPQMMDNFLRWDHNEPSENLKEYIGDPNKPHPVVGSSLIDPFGEPQNIFRIEGPEIGAGSVNCATTPGLDPNHCIETKLFRLTGKISTKVEDLGEGDLEIPDDGVFTMTTIRIPPTITASSSVGGSTTVPVVVRDFVPPSEPVVARAKIKGEVEISSRVILDGTESTGDITSYQWKQISGPPIKLFHSDKPMLIFTFPDQFATLWFELTVKTS